MLNTLENTVVDDNYLNNNDKNKNNLKCINLF